MKRSQLRAIPAVEKVLQALGDAGLPRPMVVEVVRRELAALRKQKSVPGFDAVVATIRTALRDLSSSRIRPLINGTGIVIHTNFGRAPLAEAASPAASAAAAPHIWSRALRFYAAPKPRPS
jgi:L-seryl-tRNA(Ser) seleniumtransferase